MDPWRDRDGAPTMPLTVVRVASSQRELDGLAMPCSLDRVRDA
jgi:hypothetical protein